MAAQQGRRSAAGGAVLRPRLTETITEAALAELAHAGYARMSMEAVARRAGVGKAALYRRWPSKQAMLTELIRNRAGDVLLPEPATGALRGDLRELLTAIRDQLVSPFVARVGLGLLAEARHDDALAEVLRVSVSAPRREVVHAVLQRAVDRGELPPGFDLQLGIDFVIAPLALRILVIQDSSSDDEYLEMLTNAIESALKACARE